MISVVLEVTDSVIVESRVVSLFEEASGVVVVFESEKISVLVDSKSFEVSSVKNNKVFVKIIA